ncbi:MAG: hypothetical protein RIM99_14500 [Cyclobacteriaceae bacterium]
MHRFGKRSLGSMISKEQKNDEALVSPAVMNFIAGSLKLGMFPKKLYINSSMLNVGSHLGNFGKAFDEIFSINPSDDIWDWEILKARERREAVSKKLEDDQRDKDQNRDSNEDRFRDADWGIDSGSGGSGYNFYM